MIVLDTKAVSEAARHYVELAVTARNGGRAESH
jgi:hypothetical protein